MKFAALLLSFAFIGHAAVPDAKWLKLIGGTSSDRAMSLAVDRAGNVYVTGSVSSTNVMFDDHPVLAPQGSVMFVAKFDRLGSNLWVTTGGSGNAEGRGVAVDENGNVYVAGTCGQFPQYVQQPFGTTNLTASSHDMFLAKYDCNGALQWVRQAQGAIQLATSLTISGNQIYIAGQCWFQRVDFGTTALTNAALFLARYDFDGNLVTARSLAAPPINNAFVWQIAATTNGDYYAGMNFDSASISFGGTNVSRVGQYADSVLVKWNAAGTMQWFQHLRGGFYVTCDGVRLAPNNDVVIAGRTRGGGSIAGQPVADAFLARFTSEGNLLWLNNVATNATVESVAVDSGGNSFICGALAPSVSKIGGVTITNTSPGWAPFAARFDAAGNFTWALCGSVAADMEAYFHSIALDASGSAYLSGFSRAPSVTIGSKTAAGMGYWDILLARITPEPPPLSIANAGGAVVLSWPTNQLGFVLEHASSLSSNWSAVTPPAVRDGSSFFTTNSTTSPATFFRLREE